MRLVLLFSCLVSLGCLVEVTQQSGIKDLVQLVIMFIELSVKHIGTIDLIKDKTTIPFNINKPEIIEGNIVFQKIKLSGLDGLIVKRNNIDFNLEDSIFSFCANLSIQNSTKLEIVDYEADIALINQIPLYGKGEILLGFKDIDLALCANINLTKPVQLTYFLLRPGIGGLEFQLTGFWNNSQLSQSISEIVSSLEALIMSIWAKEVDCVSCILSISIEHMINDMLNPSSAITNFYQIAELTRSDCKGDCGLVKSPFVKAIFNTNSLDLFDSLSKDDNIKKFLRNIEDYLNQYLEDQL